MMIDTKKFVDYLVNEVGVVEFCGVSDSTLKHLITEVTNRKIYIPFTNEGDAVAYAAGRTMCGDKTAVLMQNSGLTNASSAISSLTSLYNIPLIYIVGWRGKTDDDEPQHKIVGKETVPMILNSSPNAIIWTDYTVDSIKRASYNYDSQDVFFLTSKGTFSEATKSYESLESSMFPSRLDCIKHVSKRFCTEDSNVFVLSTTGYTSRELMSLGEINSHNFYMFGSMGCLISFATGVARSNPSKRFIVLDGDGSFLMRPEGSYLSDQIGTKNILHIIFKNNEHLSTGGQQIPTRDLVEFVWTSCPNSYRHITHSLDDFKSKVDQWFSLPPERCVIVAEVSNRVEKNLPRPKQTPEEVKNNFKKGLSV